MSEHGTADWRLPMAGAFHGSTGHRHDRARAVGGVASGAYGQGQPVAATHLRRDLGAHSRLARARAAAGAVHLGLAGHSVSPRYRAVAAVIGGVLFVVVTSALLATHLGR